MTEFVQENQNFIGALLYIVVGLAAYGLRHLNLNEKAKEQGND